MIKRKIFFDLLLINLSFALGFYLRFNLPFGIHEGTPLLVMERYLPIMLFISFTWISLFTLFGLYDKEKISLPLDETLSVLTVVSAGSILLLGVLFIYRELWFSRQVIFYAWGLSFFFISLTRVILMRFQSALFKKGYGIRRALILGEGEMGKILAKKIEKTPEIGYQVVGFVAHESKLKEEILKHKVHEVVIALPDLSSKKILEVVTECENLGVSFRIIPGLLEILASRITTNQIGGIPLLTIREINLKGFNALVKRSFDILFSLLILTLLSPFFLLTALLIKLDSKGPIFFKQLRVGKNEKNFALYKFRSMKKDAEDQLEELQELNESEGPLFKIKDDPRLTRVGKVLRRLSIDEFPQFINVLKGEMSVVGPRPPLPIEVEKYNRWEKKRLRVTPGITGLWQVSGRSELPFEDMVRLDIFYIENWSLLFDLKIILRTIPAVLTTSGAY